MAKENEVNEKKVPFTADQMEIIQKMLDEARDQGNSRRADSVSMYNMRDPKAIETVNVKRIDGKYVVGFENFQKDPMRKKPKYLVYKKDEIRGLLQEPFITLILSEDGVNFEKKEMLLVDYVNEGKRDQYQAKVLNIAKKEIIEDWGFLGATGDYAGAVDEKGMPEKRPTILAQTKREERVFTVELPGFEKPYDFISDYLA